MLETPLTTPEHTTFYAQTLLHLMDVLGIDHLQSTSEQAHDPLDSLSDALLAPAMTQRILADLSNPLDPSGVGVELLYHLVYSEPARCQQLLKAMKDEEKKRLTLWLWFVTLTYRSRHAIAEDVWVRFWTLMQPLGPQTWMERFVQDAFKKTEVPGGRIENSLMDEGVQETFGDRPWASLEDSEYSSDGLSFLREDAFCYYLPGFLSAALRGQHHLGSSVLWHFQSMKPSDARLQLLTRAEKQATLLFLWWNTVTFDAGQSRPTAIFEQLQTATNHLR